MEGNYSVFGVLWIGRLVLIKCGVLLGVVGKKVVIGKAAELALLRGGSDGGSGGSGGSNVVLSCDLYCGYCFCC